ncbi:lycopene beta cyclase [Haematococcus lacustris]|uniref:lycopene beta-cyclase n=1 Tax=Haematococcus lacustris TaxID=44745 RepID=A0A1S6KDX2_HAELA|nr:lycopene beta cyclase [Haematococcus lacustris]WNL53002.1 Lcyb [synthetic construct]
MLSPLQRLCAGSSYSAGPALVLLPPAPRVCLSKQHDFDQTAQWPRRRLVRASAATASEQRPARTSPSGYVMRDPMPWPTASDIALTQHDLQATPEVDLIVAGAGPSGIAVAERVAAAGFSVCVVDPEPLGIWPNNYGAWVDEFEAMGLGEYMEIVWPKASVHLSNKPEGEKFLSRPYGRVDRPRLKSMLLKKCAAHGVTFLEGKVEGVNHGEGRSAVSLADGRSIRGSLVLDATGHVRKLIKFDQKFDPGYQGAYGIVAEVESHPFDLETMLFMDWRDEHTQGNPAMHAANNALPTFLYAMPFSKTRIFLEETSLVARPAVGFDELKERLDARLKWLGIKVKAVEEEEYCLIPMGGVLPTHPQRVLGIGGTAGMVHPSTGFMMSRMLGAVPTIADAIVDQLSAPADKATSLAARKPGSEAEAEAMSAAVWRAAWPVERIRQRLFNTFGMELLLSLDLQQTRDFFSAFFNLSDFHWHGFLSTRLSFSQLLGFGITLFFKSSNNIRIHLLKLGVPGLVRILFMLAPTLRGYYKHAPTVRQQKAVADAAAAVAARTAAAAKPADLPPAMIK